MSITRSQRARIHGLYSAIITKPEQEVLAKVHTSNIETEIAYLRTICSRLAIIANANGLKHGATKPLDDRTIRTLNVLDLKLNTLLRYVRAQAFMKGEPNEYDRQIEEGEFLARKRRKVFDYLSAGQETQQSDGPGSVGDV